MGKHTRSVVIIRRSCLTGKVVWIYRGPSKEAAWKAYYRACRKEVERVEHWQESVNRRREKIARMLADLLADIPVDVPLTPEQRAEANRLQKLGQETSVCDMEFYNHIMEVRRRREEDKKIRQQMGERQTENGSYV